MGDYELETRVILIDLKCFVDDNEPRGQTSSLSV
jgi:hypothetical protein